MNSLWTLSFFFICFLWSRSLLKIVFHQIPFFKRELRELKKTKELAKHYPRLLLQWSSFLKAGYALQTSLKLLTSHPAGKHFYNLLHKPQPLIFPPDFKINFLFLKSALALSKRQGTPLSPLLDSLSKLFQEQSALAQKLRLITYPARTQAGVALVLPWFVLAIFSFLHRGFIIQTVRDPLGWIGLLSAALLEGAALLWIRRIMQ